MHVRSIKLTTINAYETPGVCIDEIFLYLVYKSSYMHTKLFRLISSIKRIRGFIIFYLRTTLYFYINFEFYELITFIFDQQHF